MVQHKLIFFTFVEYYAMLCIQLTYVGYKDAHDQRYAQDASSDALEPSLRNVVAYGQLVVPSTAAATASTALHWKLLLINFILDAHCGVFLPL